MKDVLANLGQAQLDRRALLAGGLLGGALIALSGCQQAYTRSDEVPGPLWPHDLAKDAGRPLTQGLNSKPAAQVPLAPVSGVIPRSSWTSARPIESRANPMNGISRITIHHSAVDSTAVRSNGDVARMIENIRAGHVARKGQPFADIGYHYVIDPVGRVWEGRPLRLQGAHVENQNEHNLGICVLGNFEFQTPSAASMSTLDSFVSQQMSRYGVTVSRVFTHREIGKSVCPGANLQRHMVAVRAPSGTLRHA